MPEYFTIFIFLVIAGVVASAVIGLPFIVSRILGTAERTEAKISAYECGFEPIGHAPRQFNVRFYVVAILFVVFDLEIAMFFPWALIVKDLTILNPAASKLLFASMMLFFTVLTLGFIYEWKKGALDW